MNMKKLCRAVAVVILLPAALTAQTERDRAPLKNWQAPLYWQPAPAEIHSLNAMRADDDTSPPILLTLVGITPCRVVDTRDGQGFTGEFGPPSLAGSTSRTFPLQASTTCAIPSIAQAYSLRVTAVPRGPLGFIKVYPTEQPRPLAMTLSSMHGFIADNTTIIPAGTGNVDAYASNPADLIIDINGYYAPASWITLAEDLPGGSTGDKVEDRVHAEGSIRGRSISFNSLTNSITVDSAPPAAPGKTNELYIGGDNGNSAPIPFAKIKVGIGTKAVTTGSKVTIFDPIFPSLDIISNSAKLQMSVATAAGFYSAIATPGDAVIRADGSGTEDLILAARNGNQGAIRFTTTTGPNETEKVTILSNGSVGVGTNTPDVGTFHAPVTPAPVLDVNGKVRVEDLASTGNLTLVTANPKGVLGSLAMPNNTNTVLLGNGTFGPIPGSGDPAEDWLRSGGSMYPFDLTDNVGVGTASPLGKMQIVQSVPASSGDQFGLRVHTSSSVLNGHRVGIEVQNAGPLGGFKDDVGIWVRTVNGNTPANGHANMAAVLDGNVAIGHLSVGNQEIGTQGKYVLSIKDGSAPITSPSAYQGIQLWSQSGELRVMDASLNVTTLSPHNFSMMEPSEPLAWSYYSENQTLNEKISVDMLRLIRVVERLSGERLALIRDLDDTSKQENQEDAEVPASGEILGLTAELLKARERIAALEDRMASLAALLTLTAPQQIPE